MQVLQSVLLVPNVLVLMPMMPSGMPRSYTSGVSAIPHDRREKTNVFQKILVAVDGSKQASHAVEVAADLAKRYQAAVYLVHAIRDLSLPQEILEMIAAGEITESRREILEDSADIILDNAAKQCQAAGLPDVRREILFGDPATEITGYAEEHGVNLIVVGYRGLATETDVLGGVTRKLLSMTKVSCLVVR